MGQAFNRYLAKAHSGFYSARSPAQIKYTRSPPNIINHYRGARRSAFFLLLLLLLPLLLFLLFSFYSSSFFRFSSFARSSFSPSSLFRPFLPLLLASLIFFYRFSLILYFVRIEIPLRAIYFMRAWSSPETSSASRRPGEKTDAIREEEEEEEEEKKSAVFRVDVVIREQPTRSHGRKRKP